MNANEPVVWMVGVENDTEFFFNKEWAEKHANLHKVDVIPLYTYPVKELTNEEISSIRDEFLSPNGCDIYTFARAILRKAQEK